MAKTNWISASLMIGAMLASTAASAQVTDRLPDVSIVGKRAVGIFAPASALCENAVATDPLLAQQIIAGGGDPLMGPTIYQPTRTPRTPDYNAPPKAAPGSPLPDISFKWVSRVRDRTTVARDATMDPTQPIGPQIPSVFNQNGPLLSVDNGEIVAAEQDAVARATALCRTTYAGGGGGGSGRQGMGERDGRSMFTGADFSAGRFHIAMRDKTLPMGFALFDQGRYPEALPWFEKAYGKLVDEDGGDEASLMLGKIYLQGLKEQSDVNKAIFWLKRAAGARFDATKDMPIFDPSQPDKNTPIGEAAMILANIYLTGFGGTPKDPAEARRWLARAQYVGHVAAGKALGDLYLTASPAEPGMAFQAYKKSAILDYPPAQVALGDMYYRGTDGVRRDLRMAMIWYSLAAKHQHPEALHALAVAYETGEGLPANPEQAKVYYKAAALAGNADAQTVMGSYFYEGNGQIARDPVAARKWFEQAAVAAQVDAMYNLGVMTQKGEGGEKDNAKAWAWLRMAQSGGHPKAARAVAALERSMTPAERQRAAGLYTPARG